MAGPLRALQNLVDSVWASPYLTVGAQPKSRFRGTAYVALPDFLKGMTVFYSRDGGTTCDGQTSLPNAVQFAVRELLASKRARLD